MKDLETIQREGREKYVKYSPEIGDYIDNFEAVDLDQHTSATWKVAQESAYKEIEAVFIKQVPPHAFDLEDGVWIKRLLNKAFKNNKHE